MMTLIIPRKEAPVSCEGTVVIPQPAGDEPVIKNTFFFPDIDPKRVRERMRLEQTVAPARLREAIKSGMADAYFHERRSLNNFHRDRVITFEQIAE